MTEPVKVQMIFPSGHLGASSDDDVLDTMLRVIAVAFGKEGDWCEKYGADFENDVFLMKPFCWCEKEDGSCLWCLNGDHPQFDALLKERFGTTDYQAFASRDYYDPPNFWFKPDDFRVTWYKYMGRSVATNKDTELSARAILDAVFATHPKGMTVDDALASLAQRTEETQRKWNEMFQAVQSGVFDELFDGGFQGDTKQ
jgi:hypothetical protein